MVDAIRRVAEAAGAQATMLARGDADAGAILVVTRTRDGVERAYERAPVYADRPGWAAIGPADAAALPAYLARRRHSDPDLWMIEVAGLDRPADLFAGIGV